MTALRILAALSLLSLIACSNTAPPATAANSKADDQAAAGTAPPSPPIHYDQTTVLTAEGDPADEHAYRVTLERCEKAFPTHALAPDEVEKIGRAHIDVWITADKTSRHEERWSWTVTMSPPCQFSLLHEDETDIQDSTGRNTHINHVTHQIEVQETGAWAPVDSLPDNEGDMEESERQVGWIKVGMSSSNGAPCAIWKDPTGGQLCVWAGGRKWGYSSHAAGALLSGLSRSNSIVFWEDPQGTSQWRLTTKEFSVGKAPDARVFSIPDGARSTPSP